MVERWLVVGAMGLMACTGTFRHAILKSVPDTHHLTTQTLPSGLRVVLEPERGSKRVAVAILVGAGANDDPAGREGLAHFLEHLAFRSKPTHQRSAWEELDAAGLASRGSSLSNAQTAFGSTTFVGITAAGRLPTVLPLMASLVVSPLESVDDATLEVERSVVRSERFDVDPHAGGQTIDATFAAVLPAGAAGSRPQSGTDASLAAISRADLEGFVSTYYRPENVVVSLSGDFEPQAILAQLANAFPASWLTATPPRLASRPEGAVVPRVLNPPPAPADRPVVESRVPLRRLIIAWAVPGEAVPSGLAMPVVARVLNRRLPADLPGVKRAWVELLVDSQVSALTITAELEPDTRPDTVSAAIRSRLTLGGVLPPRQLTLLEVAAFEEQNLVTRAQRRANALFSTGRPRPLEASDAEQNADALRTVQQDVITWDRARELLVAPLVRHAEALPPMVVPVSAPPAEVRLTPELLGSVALGPPLGDTRAFKLGNGLQVLLSSRPDAPVVSVALGLRARQADTTPEVRALVEATLDWDATFLATGVPRPTVEVGPDATVVQMSGRAQILPAMLDLLGNNPSPHVRWTGYGELDEAVQQAAKAPAENPWRRVLERVMPPGSAALPLAPAQLKTLSRWPFADFVTRAWNPDGAALVIDGSISLSMTEELVREIFEPWEGRSPQPVHPRPVAPPRDASPKVIENQDAAVTTVRLACRLPPGLDAKGLDLLAGNVLLAQALETTLDDDLRQSRGVTYGVTVDTTRFLTEDNALTVQVRLDPRDRQQAARLLLERLASLDGLLWSERDVDRARWHVAKERLGTTLDSESVAAWLAAVAAAGVPVQSVFPKALASAPVHLVDDAWAACVDTLAIELEGERSSLEALLKK